jgi:hypothetical protein
MVELLDQEGSGSGVIGSVLTSITSSSFLRIGNVYNEKEAFGRELVNWAGPSGREPRA